VATISPFLTACIGARTAPTYARPMLATVLTSLVRGLEGRLVEVQVDVSAGVFGFTLVGLASGSVREAKERVRSAIRNSGLPFPQRRLTVNLAPAGLRKDGSALDLAIAIAICLAELGLAPPAATAFLGELALDGTVRHVGGVLVAARWLASHGVTTLFVPVPDAAEAALAGGLRVFPCPTLAAAVGHLDGRSPLRPHRAGPTPVPPEVVPEQDLAEVQGQDAARRALETAAAGGHHLLMVGSPGAGKTMLACCLPGLLPPLTLDEALEVAQVRSVLGDLPPGRPLDWQRPFRDPHHSISTAGLIGGGSGLATPGEISRAHHGVLFLDELAEFDRPTLQALRQPLEQGHVTITRGGGAVRYPARFQLVAAANPCACGWAGDPQRACRCTPAAVEAYGRSLSGPLLDRIDLQVTVARTPLEALGQEAGGEPSAAVRQRVLRARAIQQERQGALNAGLRAPQLRRWAGLDGAARSAFVRWAAARGLSARGFHRAWRVARTLADLEGERAVGERHVMEALGYRLADRAA
jgi:magnesium chelatase family protein